MEAIPATRSPIVWRLLRDAIAFASLSAAIAAVAIWDRTSATTPRQNGAARQRAAGSLIAREPVAAPPSPTVVAPSDAASPDDAPPAALAPSPSPTEKQSDEVGPPTETPKPASDAPPPPPVVLLTARSVAPAEVAERILTQPDLNEFGNPVGDTYGLAQPGEFDGHRILVWSVDGEVQANIFPDTNPLWGALKDKGFVLNIERKPFDPAWLAETDQVWIFSGRERGLSSNACDSVVEFVKRGGGLYLAADNEPYLVDATELTRRLFQTTVSGDYAGDNVIAVRGGGITQADYVALARRDTQDESSAEAATRLAMIQRTTHYAEPHPLLTDVNFLFEGVTISHLAPSQQLVPVLHARDSQILAAVPADGTRRVVVDCGWTRYYGPPSDFVSKTAGTLRYAENIAAFLAGKTEKTDDWRAWIQRRRLVAQLSTAEEPDLRRALRSDEQDERWAALSVVGKRQEFAADVADLVSDPVLSVRQRARTTLIGWHDGLDFGPPRDASEADAIASREAWKKCLALRGGSEDELLAAITSSAAVDRRVAAALASLQPLENPQPLIQLLADPEHDIRHVAHAALVRQASGKDFGPRDAADAAQVEVALIDWMRWCVVGRFPRMRSLSSDQLRAALSSDDDQERWAAVVEVGRRDLRWFEVLVKRLADESPLMRQELRRSLTAIARGEADFGPEQDATDDDVKSAMSQWRAWAASKVESVAAQKLRLARNIYEANPQAARRRLASIVDEFPDTVAAQEARKMLNAISN